MSVQSLTIVDYREAVGKESQPAQPPTAGEGEVVGTFHRWTFMSEGEGSRFCIGVLTDKTTVKGDAAPNDLVPGISYKFAGKWVTHPKYGRSFQFKAYQQQAPHSRSAVIQYLTKYAKGIGPGWASRLWDTFGTDAVRVLREDVARVIDEVPTIPAGKLRESSIALEAYQKSEDTRIELNSLFDGRGFPKKLIDECLRVWGIAAPRVIQHDPFSLMVRKMPGAGFSRCDRLYRDLGLPLDKLKRQLMCLLTGLRENGNGNTWHPIRLAEQVIRAKIDGVTEVNWKRAVRLGLRSGWLAERTDENGAVWFTTKKQADDEKTVVRAVSRLSDIDAGDENRSHWPSADDLEGVTEHQRETCRKILGNGPFAILVGTPGTGKTTTAAKIVVACLATIRGYEIAVCAPTGKAAIRIEQSLTKTGLPPIACGTVHRLLGVNRNGHDGGGWAFMFTEANPLPYKLILIEESSMLDAGLFGQLVSAIRPGTLVLMIGDPYQLPPVDHGAPLRDLLATDIPSGELTEVLRNGGRIVQECARIRVGKTAIPSRRIDTDSENWLHIPAQTPPFVLTKLRQFIAGVGGKRFGDKIESVDPAWDVQFLCAMNDKGDLCREILNPLLQSILNPNGKPIEHTKFRIYDKVICTTNCLLPECNNRGDVMGGTPESDDEPASDESDATVFVANGDIGRCLLETKAGYVVKIQSCNRLVLVEKFASSDKGEKAADFQLAYAITFHKSQGSQWPIVVAVIDPAAQRVACRELWYTAASRPESLLVTIGQIDVLNRQCVRVALDSRKTFLASDLQSELKTLAPF